MRLNVPWDHILGGIDSPQNIRDCDGLAQKRVLGRKQGNKHDNGDGHEQEAFKKSDDPAQKAVDKTEAWQPEYLVNSKSEDGRDDNAAYKDNDEADNLGQVWITELQICRERDIILSGDHITGYYPGYAEYLLYQTLPDTVGGRKAYNNQDYYIKGIHIPIFL